MRASLVRGAMLGLALAGCESSYPSLPPIDSDTFLPYRVFFDAGETTLSTQAVTIVKDASWSFRRGKFTRIDVIGHADRTGPDQYNLVLSRRRAEIVRDRLVLNGVPAASLAVIGRGESMPLIQTPDGVREPQNRRVELHFAPQ